MVTSTGGATTPNNGSIGSSIIGTIGAGSGIDTNKLADQLSEATKSVQAGRLTTKKTLLETQISDYGLLRSSLSKLETAAASLGSADTFNAKAVSLPTTSLLSISALKSAAVAGDYRLQVDQIAQAQSMTSGNFASPAAPVGKGTLTIRLGEWNDALNDFSVDSTKTGGGTITIDDSNNSLTGLRDSINKAGIGVTASIVSGGGSYKLLLTSKSGAKNEIEITAAELPGSAGLAGFNFNETDRQMTQQQAGLDAKIRVNGLQLSRESNHITDAVEGMEFDIFAASTTETVAVNISDDKTIAETAIRDFVAAYNTFRTEVEKLVGFDEELKDYGSLKTDPLAKNLTQGIRNVLTSSIPGLGEGFSTLSSLGIRTERDGSLKIIEDEGNTGFRAAIDNNFESVRDLFVPKMSADVTGITVNKYTGASQPGSYDVVITQQASKGSLDATNVLASFPINTASKDYSFAFKLDGAQTASITLPANKNYASGQELAAEIQSLINLDSSVKTAKASVNVTFDGSKLNFASAAYGSSSTVEFTAIGADMGDLGIAVGAGTAGKDVAGTVNGKEAFGFGNVLLPALGSEAEGLSMIIEPGTTSGKITFSRGLAGGLSNLVNDYLKSSGLIKEREATITKNIDKVKDDETTLDRRTEAYRARLMAQFTAMESIVRSLSSTGDFLDGIVDRLPFTARS